MEAGPDLAGGRHGPSLLFSQLDSCTGVGGDVGVDVNLFPIQAPTLL